MELLNDPSHRIVLTQSKQSHEGLTRHETYSIDWTINSFNRQTWKHETVSFQVKSKPLLRLVLETEIESECLVIKLTAETAVERKGTLNFLLQNKSNSRTILVHFIGPNTCVRSESLGHTYSSSFQSYMDGKRFTLQCVLSLQSDIGFQGELQTTVHSNFKKLLKDTLFSDVILCLGETELPAHKAVLSEQSTVFRAMFEHEMKETKENRVVIEDIEPDVMKALPTYMYTGTIENSSELVEDLLKACDYYDLNESALFSYCEEIQSIGIAKENVFQVLVFADCYHAEQLKGKAVDFILVETLFETPEWSTFKETNKDLAIGILECLENTRFQIKISHNA